MTMNELIYQAHELAKTKGWWDKDYEDAGKIALMHSEISEAFENYGCISFPSKKIEGFSSMEEELADLLIRLADWMGYKQLESSKVIYDGKSEPQGASADFVAKKLCDLHWQVSQLLEALRNGTRPGPHCDDIVLAVNGVAMRLNLRLADAVRAKHEYNSNRAYKHGGKAF